MLWPKTRFCSCTINALLWNGVPLCVTSLSDVIGSREWEKQWKMKRKRGFCHRMPNCKQFMSSLCVSFLFRSFFVLRDYVAIHRFYFRSLYFPPSPSDPSSSILVLPLSSVSIQFNFVNRFFFRFCANKKLMEIDKQKFSLKFLFFPLHTSIKTIKMYKVFTFVSICIRIRNLLLNIKSISML